MKVYLLPDKLTSIQEELTDRKGKKKGKIRQMLSLVGSSHHTAEFVYNVRTLVSTMYATAAKVKELDYFTRLNMEFHSDLLW